MFSLCTCKCTNNFCISSKTKQKNFCLIAFYDDDTIARYFVVVGRRDDDIHPTALQCHLDAYVNKSGAWYSYNGNKLGQGLENTKQVLEDNPEMLKEITEATMEKAGITRTKTE